MSNEQSEKRVLLITYHYPPSLAVGGLRMKGFVKHMPQYGWKPYVLTLDEKHIENKDTGPVLEAEHIKIARAGVLPSARDSYLFIKKLLRRDSKPLKPDDKEIVQQKSDKSNINQNNKGVVPNLKRYINSLFISLPDTERNWILPAVKGALKEIRNEKIDVILTSGPPHSVHIAGLLVNILTHTRWVADFRDPWMTPFNKTLYPTCQLSNSIERWLERKIFQKASLVLTTTKRLNDKFEKEYGAMAQNKIKFFPNGFDEEDFEELSKLDKYEIFTISYTGSIYFGRSPEPLFKAIRELIDEKLLKQSEIRIKLIGNCRVIGEQSTADVVSSYGLDSIVEVSDYVPYKKALEVVKLSHLALLLATDQPYQIPAKVYDYMGTGTTILALTKEGATSDVLNSTGIGRAIAPEKIQDIKNYIQQLILTKTDSAGGGDISCNQYIRSNIVKGLALELDRIVADET